MEAPSMHVQPSRWDLSTQTPHGGQEWSNLPNFVEDFSVTTNPLGTPKSALAAALSAGNTICHYPPSDYEPAKSEMAKYLCVLPESFCKKDASNSVVDKPENLENFAKQFILGNGASELIDLSVRCIAGKTWRPGPQITQYKEYERSATTNGYKTLSADNDAADLLCIVNPCNPAGDFMDIHQIKKYIESHCKQNSSVIVDESMLPFLGPAWRSQSLVSQREWVLQLSELNIKVFVVHSWTKIWACPGLRIGSLLCPTNEDAQIIRQRQIPWSMNVFAISFIPEVVRDAQYMQNTWSCIAKWREHMVKAVQRCHPCWKIFGETWMPFLWISVTDEAEAAFYVDICKKNGMPIRWGKYGYNLPQFIRIAVRHPDVAALILEVLNQPVES